MNKNEFLKKLNNIYNGLDSLPENSSLRQAAKDLDNLKDELGDVITDLEDNGLYEIELDKE